MKKVVLYAETGIMEFKSFDEMFQELSGKGEIIDEVKDGVLVIKGKELPFAIQTSEGTAELFIKEVDTYRSDLRESIMKLKKQGIEVSKTEIEKMKKQFAFLPQVTATPAAE